MTPEITAELYDVEIRSITTGEKIARGLIYGHSLGHVPDGTLWSTSEIIKIEGDLIHTATNVYRYSIFPKPKPKPVTNDRKTADWLAEQFCDRAADDPSPETKADARQVQHLTHTFGLLETMLKTMVLNSDFILKYNHHSAGFRDDLDMAKKILARIEEPVE